MEYGGIDIRKYKYQNSNEIANVIKQLYELTNEQRFLVESFYHNPRRVEGIYNLVKHYCCENKNTISWKYYRWIQNYYEKDFLWDNRQKDVKPRIYLSF